MNICLDMSLASKYTSHSQMARVVTEQWVEKICSVRVVERVILYI